MAIRFKILSGPQVVAKQLPTTGYLSLKTYIVGQVIKSEDPKIKEGAVIPIHVTANCPDVGSEVELTKDQNLDDFCGTYFGCY